jgi:hypothetical protein
MDLRASTGWLDPLYTAHFRTKEAQVQAVLKIEAERAAARQSGDDAPDWWKHGNFVPSDDWDEASAPAHPYLRIVVEVTERNHDGYCSGIDEDEDGEFHVRGDHVEIEETVALYTGCLPLHDWHGDNWEFKQGDALQTDYCESSDFLCPPIDPGWRCASGGSGVCGVRPSVRFVSMTHVK